MYATTYIIQKIKNIEGSNYVKTNNINYSKKRRVL